MMKSSMIVFLTRYFIQMIKPRRMTCAGLVAYEGKKNIAYRVLVIKPQEKRSLGKERCSWE
jgi:hypothetical protein